MSIMDKLFGSSQPSVPSTPPAAATPASAPATPPATAKPTEPASPLADFATLWQTPAPDPNAPVGDPPLFQTPDPAKLAAAVGKMDFTKSLPPEVVAKLGNESATVLQAINAATQAAFAQALLVNSKMVEAGLTNVRSSVQSSLPQFIRSVQAGDKLASNPVFSNPAVQPIVELLKSQIASKEPNLSAEQLAAKAEMYMTGVAAMINGGNGQGQGNQPPRDENGFIADTDWEAFFDQAVKTAPGRMFG